MENTNEESEHPLTQERLVKWAKGGAGVIVSTAAVAAAWITLGWPVPATTAYVIEQVQPVADNQASLESFMRGTRIIVLRQRQGKLVEEIRDLEAELQSGTNTRHIATLINIKNQEKNELERQIEKMEVGQ